MKKKLALLMVTAMIASMVPATAFAASSNDVITIPTVNKDDKFTNTTTTNAPILKIELQDGEQFRNGDYITLKLENAEWQFSDSTKVGDEETLVTPLDDAAMAIQAQQAEYQGYMDAISTAFAVTKGAVATSDVLNVVQGVYNKDAAGTITFAPNAYATLTGAYTSVTTLTAPAVTSVTLSKKDAEGNAIVLTDATAITKYTAGYNAGIDYAKSLVKVVTDKATAVGMKATQSDIDALLKEINGVLPTAQTKYDFYKDLLTHTSYTNGRYGVSKVERTSDLKTVYVKVDELEANQAIDVDGDSKNEATVMIPMLVKAKGGTATVSISSNNGKVSENTRTLLYATDGSVSITSAGKADTFTESQTLKDIVIAENKFGKLTGQYEVDVIVAKGFELDATDAYVAGTGAIEIANTSITRVDNNFDQYKVKFNVTKSSAQSTRFGAVSISKLKVKSTRDSVPGDVNIQVRAGSNHDGSVNKNLENDFEFVGTTYADYAMTLKADGDLPTLVTGRMPESTGKQEDGNGSEYDFQSVDFNAQHKVVKAILSEAAPNSWLSSRRVDFMVPEGVKILSAKVKPKEMNIGSLTKDNTARVCVDTCGEDHDQKAAGGSLVLKDNILSIADLTFPNREKVAKVELELWVSVDADYDKDVVTLTADASNFADPLTLDVAKVIDPVTVSFDTKEVKIGYQDIALNDITIKENVPGALKDGQLVISLDNLTGSKFQKGAKVELVAGDMKLGKDTLGVSNGAITLDISRSSYKTAAELKISNVAMTIDRDPAEGFYSLLLGGSAIVQDGQETGTLQEGFFRTTAYEFEKFLNVITAAPDKDGKLISEVVLTIGSDKLTVGGKEATVDGMVAPYLSAEGRTMMPVRAISTVFGGTVGWDDATQTVTVMSNDRIISMQVGSKTLYVNGVAIPMDSEVVTKDSRAYIPVAYLANALGVPYTWNGDAQTVTFNPLAK